MFFNVLKIDELVNFDENKIQKKLLLENGDSKLMLVAIKKDEILDTHYSEKDACAIVIEGEIEMHFEAEKFTINKGELLMFKKNMEHKVLAKKDSRFIVVRI